MMKFRSRFAVIALCLFSYVCPSYAGYSQLKPPPGWSQGTGTSVPGQAGTFAFGAAANQASVKSGTVLTNAALNVGGQQIVVPASMRIAANAGSLAATFAFGNPYLFAGIAAGSALYQWYTNKGYSTDGSAWFAESPRTCTATYCTEFRGTYGSTAGAWSGSSVTAGQSLVDALNASPGSMEYRLRIENGYRFLDARERNGLYPWMDKYDQYAQGTRDVAVTPASKVPVEKSKFISDLSALPVPDALPALAPGVAFPVELPVVNPDPAVAPAPAPSPAQQPRSLWVPTGNPVKNPNSDPANKPDTWTEPGVRVTPSPTPTDPWRVDVVDEPKTKTDATSNVSTPPVSNSPKPDTDNVSSDTPLPAPPKLYKQKYPDGLAGVWKTQRDLMVATPLFTLAKGLMPAVAMSGTCPKMPVNLTFASWANYGVKDVAPPCQVWDWGKAIIIVSALLLARRLIFGG